MDEGRFSNAFSLTDEIAEIIRERILKGEYKIGEKIKENQLATELRVSRTPIREAFKQLETEGLMEYVPNRGCFARGFTKRDIQDIYSVRKALEQLAVEWAVDRITDDEIETLKGQIDLMEFYTNRNDTKKVLELNNEFHQTIYGSTRSRFLSQILRSYQDYVNQARRTTLYGTKNLNCILEEHKGILAAIIDRDAKEAVARTGRHLDLSRERAEDRWGIK